MPAEPKLVVALEARLSRFEKQLRDAGVVAERQAANIESKFDKISPNFAGLKKSLALIGTGVSVASLVNMMKQITVGFGDIQDAADRAQVSTDFIQVLSLKVQQAGGSLEDAARAASRFGKELADVNNENSELGKFFRANRVDVRQFGGDAEAAFGKFAEMISASNQPLKVQQLVMQVFGDKIGPKFISTLKEVGAVGIQSYIDQMKKAGLVADAEIIKKADEMGDRLLELWTRFKVAGMDDKTIFPNLKSILDEFERFIDLLDRVDKAITSFVTGQEAEPVRTQIRISGKPPVFPPPKPAELDAFQKEADQTRKQIALLENERDNIDATTAAREAARITIELETAAKEANRKAGLGENVITDKQRATIEGLAAAYGALKEQIERANLPLAQFVRENRDLEKNLNDVAVSGLKSFEDELVNIAFEAKNVKDAFNDMVKSILVDLARMLIRMQITIPVAQALSSAISSFTGGGGVLPGGAALGQGGIGHAAGGGPVSANAPYVVGEKGPEIFVPKTSGTIVPHGTPRPNAVAASGASAPLKVEIKNYGGAKVQSNGMRREGNHEVLQILVDSAVGKSLNTPGTAGDRAMTNRGVGFPLHRRG